ncbi:unnamed protein product, partial [Phaeothamnion confervicola]
KRRGASSSSSASKSSKAGKAGGVKSDGSGKRRSSSSGSGSNSSGSSSSKGGEPTSAGGSSNGGTNPCGRGDGLLYINLGEVALLDGRQAWQLLQGAAGGGTDGDMTAFGPPRRVLWAMAESQRAAAPISSTLPARVRVKLAEGLPHLAIVAHPCVRAVVSHCSAAAVQEALLFAKPLLCLPSLLGGGHPNVAVAAAAAGAAIMLPRRNFTAQEVAAAAGVLLAAGGAPAAAASR